MGETAPRRTYPALDLTWPVRPDEGHIERLLAEVDEDGPLGVEERPDGLRVYFESSDGRSRAAVRIIAIDAGADCLPVDVPDDGWAERGQAGLEPVHVGALVIDPREDGVVAAGVILIRPSTGFGTGHHASTRLCLTLLQRTPLAGTSVLDVGTGSGVLAIAAWRLGAHPVVGLDRDPDALAAARESVERNRASASVRLVLGALERFGEPGPFDVVLANLTGALISREAGALARATGPRGRLIASGFTTDDEPGVRAALEAAGFSVGERAEEAAWVGLGCSKTGGPLLPAAERP